jgi:hypothetical protein
MTTRIKLRRDTAANWLDSNPILAAGEPGLETDTGKVKYGDGTSTWTVLNYSSGGAASLTDEGNVVVTAGSTEHWIATQRREQQDTLPCGLRYDSEGNLYTLTKTYDAYTSNDVAIITKYTAAGAIAWQKSFTEFAPTSLAVDSSDCAYITLNPSAAPVVIVVKFSATGDIQWQKDYNIGPVAAQDAFIEEKSDTTLALAFTGQSGETSGPNIVVVMEISSTDGTVQIKKQLASDDLDQQVYATGIDVDSDENVFVTGWYYDVGDDTNKMFIEKLDEDLDRVWTKSLETDNAYNMNGGDCASDALGNIYVVGSYSVDTGNIEGTGSQTAGVLVKLNSTGTVQWTRRIGPGPCGGFAAGLTVTESGNVYLSAITFVKKADNEFIDEAEFDQEAYGVNKLIVARYNTQGDVVWQRYVDVRNLYEQWDEENVRGQAVAVFGDKFAVDGFGDTWNTSPWTLADSADNEADYFVAQLPTDGTTLTIGNLDFTESRVPGRFITHTTSISPLAITNYAEAIVAETSSLTTDADVKTANDIVKSDTYDYTFGADGTLTIPNDGDVKLTQNQVGYLMALGGSQNYDDNIYGRAVTVDTQGNMYLVGQEEDDNQPFVTKINPEGVRQWSVIINEDVNYDNGRANGVAIDPTTGNVKVVCEMYDNYTYSVLFTIDQDTGRILSHEKFSDSDSDVYLIDIAYNSNNEYVLAGSKMGEFSAEIPVTAQTGSANGMIKILRSDVPGVDAYNWQIGGTGFSVFENVLYVERYTGLTGTVRQGSGATFTVQDNGDTTYSYSITTPGTNYLPGHKIKFLGGLYGGADGVNDVIFTVASVNENGGVTSVTVSGTAAGAGPGSTEWPNQAGTNVDVGSGFELTLQGSRYSNSYNDYQGLEITNSGTNYVENDLVVIPGTSLGGTSPNNDLTVRVAVNTGAVPSWYDLAGTSQSTTWKLETTTQVDFAGTGTWTITYPLSRENLLITDNWTRTFGTAGDNTDRLYAVAVDSDDNIIAVGEGYGNTSNTSNDDLAMVYKFNNTGTLQWSRKLNETDDDCYAKSVVTIGTDIYVIHESNDDGESVVTKLDSTGTIKWQRITDSGDDSVIAATTDGNILVAVEAYNSESDEDCIKVFMLTPGGEVVYKRWLTAATDESTRFKNGRGLVVDGDSFYITGYFDGNDYDSTMAVRLPLDGSGTGEYGSFRYVDVNTQDGNFFGEGQVNSDNYNIGLVDLEGESNYAGELAEGEVPYIKTTSTVTTNTGNFYVNTWYPQVNVEVVRDTDGGNIVFADGTIQSTSATDIPQRRFYGQRYTLGMKDRGHHILCKETNDNITIPYNARVEFPVGTKIVIVNTEGSDVYVNTEGGGTSLMVTGSYNGYTGSAYVRVGGVGTLMKIGREEWVLFGDVGAY